MSKLRQDRMTSAGRLDALFKGKPIDRVPLLMFGSQGFCARNVGYSIASMYDDPQKSFDAQVRTQEQFGFQVEPSLAYASYGAWEFGGDCKLPSIEWEQAPKVVRYPVETEKDAWELKLPDVTKAGLLPQMMEFSKILAKHNLPVQTSCGSPFTRAGNICGAERLCRWLIKKPEVAHHLIRLSTDHLKECVQYWVDTFGAERIAIKEAVTIESNLLVSAKHYVDFSLPYEKELHEKILSLGVKYFSNFHLCGDHNLNLPYIAQVQMGERSIVSFAPEVDFADMMKYFGDRCIIAGNVNTTAILAGTPQQVYELSKQCILKGKKSPRGFMLTSGCDISPMTPPYNVYMMRKAIDDFGWYD